MTDIQQILEKGKNAKLTKTTILEKAKFDLMENQDDGPRHQVRKSFSQLPSYMSKQLSINMVKKNSDLDRLDLSLEESEGSCP